MATDGRNDGAVMEPGTLEPVDPDGQEPGMVGVVVELGTLGAGAIVSKAGLARMLHKHPVSVDRAIQRGELPKPVKFMGGMVWTAGVLTAHFERRLEAAAKEVARRDGVRAQHTP